MMKTGFLLVFLLIVGSTIGGFASSANNSHDTAPTRWLLRGGQSCTTDEDCPQQRNPCDKTTDNNEQDCPLPFVCDSNSGKCKQEKKKKKTTNNNKDDRKEGNEEKQQVLVHEKNGEEEDEEEENTDLALATATEMPSATEFPTTLLLEEEEDDDDQENKTLEGTIEVTPVPSEEETAECSIDNDCLSKEYECIEGTCALIRQDRICGPIICPEDQTCCNSSCGICTSPGMACFREICEPKKKKYMKCNLDSDCRNDSDEICEDGKCVAVTVLDPVPKADRECYEDLNCPPLDCITTPCPQYRCIDYACVLEDDL